MTTRGAGSDGGLGGRRESAAPVRAVHVGYPWVTDASEGTGALAAPPLQPLSYLVGTVGSVHGRQDLLVFRDAAQVTESVAAAIAERQK